MDNYTINKGGRYPTKKEILDSKQLHTKLEIKKLQRWKNLYFTGWSKMPKKVKLKLIEVLIKTLAPKNTEIRYHIVWQSIPRLKFIYIGETPSIISSLHEIGHLKHGDSELDACRYSVHLFKEVFPEAYAKLSWKGHLLVKNKV